METIDHIETWYKVTCPSCEETNWVCDGDTTNFTDVDVEGMKCWSCKKEFVFEGVDDYYRKLNLNIKSSANIEEGKEKPD
jgi:transposase-like protein